MKKTLLYFEEMECPLSKALFNRDDINIIILRTTKNLKFFSPPYLEQTKKYNVYVSNYEENIYTEAQKFKEWCAEKNINIDCFLSDSEYYLEYANNFARLLGLEALSEDQVKWVRDKVSMKEKFCEGGIKTTEFAKIESKKDLINYWINQNGKTIIVKPRSEMNSKGVYKISSMEDIETIPYEIVPDKYMVEVFCYGHEWSIESMVQNGKVLDSYLSYLPNATIWASIENKLHAHMTYLGVPEYFKFNPKDYIQRIVDTMKLKNGTMTIEVFVLPDGTPIASELGWRLPGGMACENHSLSYGFNIWNTLIDIALNNKVELQYSEKKRCVGVLSLPNVDGEIKYVTPLDELLKMNGAFEGEIYAKVGEYQKKRRVGSDKSGWIHVAGHAACDVEKKMQLIYDYFQIETVQENERKKVRTYEK